MDAAGKIDYSILENLAESKGVRIADATSGCTVCDGPESAIRELATMQDLDHVVIELSGQMPLTTMMRGLASEGVVDPQTFYLLDPRNFTLVQAADEVPYAHVIGITKSDVTPDVVRHAPNARIVRIHEQGVYTLDKLFEGVDTAPFAVASHHHHHHGSKGMVTKWFGKVLNPYHTADQIEAIIKSLAGRYDRIKGHVALDAERILRLHTVFGECTFKVEQDASAGNGTLLFVNQSERYFPEAQAVEDAHPFIDSPDIVPVLRRGSTRESFVNYVGMALAAQQYDDAMGAAAQLRYEQEDESLVVETLPAYAEGKLKLIQSGQHSRSQRLLEGMSALWFLQENPGVVEPTIQHTLERIYCRDFAAMTGADWKEIERGSDPEETRWYIKDVHQKIPTRS